MCGILFCCSTDKNIVDDVKKNFYLFQYRGPDESVAVEFKSSEMYYFFGFHRLAIIGIDTGNQPFRSNGNYLMCNGEIYNYKELQGNHEMVECSSDCEIILKLYEKFSSKTDNKNSDGDGMNQVIQQIRGEYAFVLLDTHKNKLFIGRDIFGIRPLFYTRFDTTTIVSSEQFPAFREENGYNLFQFPPKTVHEISISNAFERTSYIIPLPRTLIRSVKYSLIDAVARRLQSEKQIGFLLSGGLDSSLVLAIAVSIKGKSIPYNVFSIGFDDPDKSPDIIYAKKVVEFLEEKYKVKINHHIVCPTIKQGIDAIPRVIKHLATYDTTTVRASTPMFLLAEYIKENTDVKVILTGEGADECQGGYLYFHYAPSKEDHMNERWKLLDNIHYFDVLRADRCLSAFGLECRVPYLDEDFISSIMGQDLYSPDKIEKYYIREIFDSSDGSDYLPREVLYRQKDAFSNAVAYSYVNTLKKEFEFEQPHPESKNLYPLPRTGEENYYQKWYIEYFWVQSCIPYFWLPNQDWIKVSDSSACELPIHNKNKTDDE